MSDQTPPAAAPADPAAVVQEAPAGQDPAQEAPAGDPAQEAPAGDPAVQDPAVPAQEAPDGPQAIAGADPAAAVLPPSGVPQDPAAGDQGDGQGTGDDDQDDDQEPEPEPHPEPELVGFLVVQDNVTEPGTETTRSVADGTTTSHATLEPVPEDGQDDADAEPPAA